MSAEYRPDPAAEAIQREMTSGSPMGKAVGKVLAAVTADSTISYQDRVRVLTKALMVLNEWHRKTQFTE